MLIQTPAGLGSGFIISEDGLAVTNYHVVEKETRLAATLYVKEGDTLRRRRVRDVELVALNPFIDLALVRIPKPGGGRVQAGLFERRGGLPGGRHGVRHRQPAGAGAERLAGDPCPTAGGTSRG